MIKNDPFDELVGQKQVKKHLNELLRNFYAGAIVPHALIVAPKGCGKTEIGKAFVRGLGKQGKLFNCAGIKNVEGFFNDIVIQRIHDQDVTLFFDDAHLLPKPVQAFMLSMLNPNKDHCNTVTNGDVEAFIDFRRQSFVFATTDPQGMSEPLRDRCERIDLQDYPQEDIAKIIGDLRPEIEDYTLLMDIANYARGNARGAVKLANQMEGRIAQKEKAGDDHSVFDRADWNGLVDVYGHLPYGIRRKEMMVLELISKAGTGIALGTIAFRVSDSPTMVRLDTEAYLRNLDLIAVNEQSKRVLTPKGRALMDSL